MITVLILVLRCSVHMLRCLSMPNCSMHMPIGWNGLSMPTEGILVCMPTLIINFMVRGVEEDSVQYMTLVKLEADNTLSFKVYRKPTLSDQYLQWDSHHNLVAKYSVISTLTHRARTVCTKPDLLNNEIQHLRKALTKCKYPGRTK